MQSRSAGTGKADWEVMSDSKWAQLSREKCEVHKRECCILQLVVARAVFFGIRLRWTIHDDMYPLASVGTS